MLFTTHIFLFGFLPVTLASFWALRSTHVAARLPRARVVRVLRVVGLALPSADVRFDLHRLRGGSAALTHRRSTAPPSAARRRALDQPGTARALQVRGFFLGVRQRLASLLGGGRPFPALAFLLPVGISFYTFNSICYTIDVYRRAIPADRNLLALRDVRRALPAPDRRADRPLLGDPRPARAARAAAHGQSRDVGICLPRVGLVKKLAHRRHAGAHGRPAVRRATRISGWRLPGSRRSATLSRSTSTSRATPTWRSGSRSCSASASRELRLTVPGDVDHRLLAALAHLALDVPARLPLHPARRVTSEAADSSPATSRS